MYIGACRHQLCDTWVHNAWMEYSALGYSGTNSGGNLVISNSQFDNNQDGFDTNTQIASDPPPIQNGACPDNGASGLTHTNSCWTFMDNYVHDNNNPNVPGSGAGYAGAGPVGTGMTLSGGRDDTVLGNLFANNGSWGLCSCPLPTPTPRQRGSSARAWDRRTSRGSWDRVRSACTTPWSATGSATTGSSATRPTVTSGI